MIRSRILRSLLGVGLLCGAGIAVQAQNPVTFQVDMTQQTTATSVSVRGSFNGWGTTALTDNGSGVYTGTVSLADAPGTVENYKFHFNPGDSWESPASTCGGNRTFTLAAGGQTLPVVYWNDAPPTVPNNNVSFQVDMTAQVILGQFNNGVDEVRVSGSFTGWGGGELLTNNPALPTAASNIYSGVLVVPGVTGACQAYKFRAVGGWESPSSTGGGNRTFQLAGGDQVLPLVYYNDLVPGVPTNNITFQVDMTAQILLGNFDNSSGLVTVSGDFTGWGTGTDLTNNPAAAGNVSNIWSMVIPIIGAFGDSHSYKFRMNGGWEEPTSTGGDNRTFRIAVGDQTLPLVFYNDQTVCDSLLQDTTVTFRLHLTNFTLDVNGVAFNNLADQVYINGLLFPGENWGDWNTSLPELTNNPVGSDFYETTVPIPKGKRRATTFKFGIAGPGHGGLDNEAPQLANHISYIRTYDASYTMPVAEFGTNYAATRVEQPFGNLTAGAAVGGNIPITWLGLPCVTLQTKSSLAPGAWTDLPATDAANSTNWPNTGGEQFFRLQKRPLP